MPATTAQIIKFPLEQTSRPTPPLQNKEDVATSHHLWSSEPLKAQIARRNSESLTDEQEEAQDLPISTEQLYYNRQAVSQELSLALHLLGKCSSHARVALAEMDRAAGRYTLDADVQIQQIQAVLPDLYACRELGDGFAGIVIGLQFAFDNLQGNPLTREQVHALASLLEKLHDEPFISHSRAMDYLIKFEEAGFNSEPVALEELLNIFDEQD